MISLNYRDGRPIYEQVKDGLRRLMISGAVQAGEKLPSVRALAAALAINPNTIQRAYEALEQEGYVRTETGKGSFAASREQVATGRRDDLLAQFDALSLELLYLGLRPEELYARLQSARRRREEENLQ